MAPKPEKEDPQAASSSEEEASSDEEETEASYAEPQSTQKKSGLQKPEESFSALRSESEEEEEEEEEESESEPEDGSDTDSDSKTVAAVGQNVKPSASKPMEDSQAKSSKPKAKPAPATPVSKLTAATGKRAAVGGETDESKDVKRRKEENTEDTKKQLFQRLWSEDDEIALLSGMIEFTEKKRVDPTRDLAGFYDFIKKSLSVEVSQSQLKEKIGRLRRKFSKANEGEDKSFSKAHDREVFDLSKKIWGTSKKQAEPSNRKGKVVNNGDSCKLAAIKADLGIGNGKEDKMEIEKHEPLKGNFNMDWYEDMGKFVAMKGLDFVEGSKRGELEKRWKEVKAASLDLLVKRSQLMIDQAKLMLDAMED